MERLVQGSECAMSGYHWGCTDCFAGSNKPLTTQREAYVACNNHSYDTGHFTVYAPEAKEES